VFTNVVESFGRLPEPSFDMGSLTKIAGVDGGVPPTSSCGMKSRWKTLSVVAERWPEAPFRKIRTERKRKNGERRNTFEKGAVSPIFDSGARATLTFDEQRL
jgi:hypothetical protein